MTGKWEDAARGDLTPEEVASAAVALEAVLAHRRTLRGKRNAPATAKPHRAEALA